MANLLLQFSAHVSICKLNMFFTKIKVIIIIIIYNAIVGKSVC